LLTLGQLWGETTVNVAGFVLIVFGYKPSWYCKSGTCSNPKRICVFEYYFMLRCLGQLS